MPTSIFAPRQTPSRRQQRGMTKINNNSNNNKQGNCNKGCSLSTIIVYLMVGVMFVYVTTMVALTRYTTTTNATAATAATRGNDNNLRNIVNNNSHNNNNKIIKNNNNDNPVPYKKQYSREEWGDRNHPYNAKREWGHGVVPEKLAIQEQQQQKQQDQSSSSIDEEKRNPYNQKKQPKRILTAYIEPIDQSIWQTKPLPQRTWASEDLQSIQYNNVNSCRNLPGQWPVDDPPTNDDPFLPWIHDVFPTHDGQYIQFVAQNRHRCRTGSTQEEKDIMAHMKPQVALFQHVAVKRVNNSTTSTTTQQRYKLVDHSEADPDGMATRFICRFQPSGQETLSIYNFLYEYASYRKKSKVMFHEDTGDNKLIHTSQLTFLCPVPQNLQSQIRTGESVIDDYATIFVDLIPIRTPPRYGPPNEFFPPYYKEFRASQQGGEGFNPKTEWGNNHVLPKIENSGRWENIPICKPTLAQYGKKSTELTQENNMGITPPIDDDDSTSRAIVVDGIMDTKPYKSNAVQTHRLVSCLWASTGYATRGNRFAINDGQRRLLEWIEYNKLIGVEHFYLYDNSGAFDSNNIDLKPISDMFPDDVTVINWPSKVCNNNPNNVDSVGERSSQYAAEASCRLRFGPHVSWIQQFDLDEYLVPMGNLTSIHPLLDKLEEEGKKIVSFGSWRAWPRRRFIEDPNKSRLSGAKYCSRNTDCFQLKVPMNYTILQAYNCDRQKPGKKKERMPAEKQLYKPDYVKHHFIHYSTVTINSILNREDTNTVMKLKFKDKPFPDPLSRFGDEVNEALMLHTKAVATQDTIFWESACNATYDGKAFCRLGSPFPDDMTGVDESKGDEGWKLNCYVNNKLEDYWIKLLDSQLKQHVPEIAMRLIQEEEH